MGLFNAGKVAEKLIDGISNNYKIKDKIGLAEAELRADLQRSLTETLANLDEAQVEINKIEATQDSIWSKWRKALGWVCVLGVSYHTFIYPLLHWFSEVVGIPSPPDIEIGTLMTLLTGILGLGVQRTVENIKGNKDGW